MSVVYIYDEHLKVLDITDTSAMIEAKIDMKINEASTLDISSTFKFPEGFRYVALTDPIAQRRGYDDEFLMYRISTSAIEDDGTFQYTFTEFAYDELAYDGYIVEERPVQSSFDEGLDLILNGTNWKRGLTNIEGTEDLDFFYMTRIEAISALNDKFPAEFRFWLRLNDDGTIAERIVDAVQKRGLVTGKRFETTSNLISLVAEDDYTNLYSAIVPRGKGEEIDGDGDPNTKPGYGRKINIKDVEWSKANGDPLDKPLGQEWLALDNGETLVDGRLRYKIVGFDDDTDPNVLINHAYIQLVKDSIVKRQFTANALDLGVSELGDTVHLVDKAHRMEYEARIFRVVYDMVSPENTQVEFGDDIVSENSISNVVSNVVIQQSQLHDNTNWAIQQADGKNTTYSGPDEPSGAVREGDIWFKSQDNGTTQMYRYEDGAWVSRDSMDPERIMENFYKNGELDANRINVVNLNASNIISGSINTQLINITDSTNTSSLTLTPKNLYLYNDKNVKSGVVVRSSGSMELKSHISGYSNAENVGGLIATNIAETGYEYVNGIGLYGMTYHWSGSDSYDTEGSLEANDYVTVGYKASNGNFATWLRGISSSVGAGYFGKPLHSMQAYEQWQFNNEVTINAKTVWDWNITSGGITSKIDGWGLTNGVFGHSFTDSNQQNGIGISGSGVWVAKGGAWYDLVAYIQSHNKMLNRMAKLEEAVRGVPVEELKRNAAVYDELAPVALSDNLENLSEETSSLD